MSTQMHDELRRANFTRIPRNPFFIQLPYPCHQRDDFATKYGERVFRPWRRLGIPVLLKQAVYSEFSQALAEHFGRDAGNVFLHCTGASNSVSRSQKYAYRPFATDHVFQTAIGRRAPRIVSIFFCLGFHQ